MLAFWVGAGDTWWVLGKSDPNAELLDAAALCRHLVAEGSMHAFLADHRRVLFPDAMFGDLFPSGRGRPSVPADVVAAAKCLSATGLSLRGVAAQLAAAGHLSPSGKQYGAESVKHMLAKIA